jgi:septal ring factor EnvC (AmiA/AmiB activator)
MMKNQILFVFFLFVGFSSFSQQSYSWEGQAKEILLKTDELLPDTSDSVLLFKESLQSLIRESFQSVDSYKVTADSLGKEVVALKEQNVAKIKIDEKIKLYFLAGAGGIVFILLVLLFVFIIRSSKLKTKLNKAVAENKNINTDITRLKLEEEQVSIKMERLNTELTDSLSDCTALNNKNKELVNQNTEYQKNIDEARANLAALKLDLEKAESQNQNNLAEVSVMQSQIDTLKVSLLDAEKENTQLKVSLLEKENGISADLIEVKEKLKKSDGIIQSMKTGKTIAENKLIILQSSYAGFEKLLNQQKEQTELLMNEKQHIASELTELFSKNLSLQADNAGLKSEIEGLKVNVVKETEARLRIDRELEKFVEELKGFLPLP